MYKKKSANKTKKRTTKKKSPKKSKVYVPFNKVVVFFVVIVVICSVLLYVNTYNEYDNSSIDKLKDSVEKIVNDSEKNASNSSIKNQENKKESLNLSKNEEAKKTENSQKSQKSESENQNSENSNVLQKNEQESSYSEKREQTQIQKEKSEFYYFPQAQNNAQLVIVLDDGGQNINHLKNFLDLPFSVTIAVLPKLAYTKDCANLISSSRHELILHQPMQAIDLSVNPGKGAILPNMSVSESVEILLENLNELGANVKGVNNHEGSLITEDEIKMSEILQTLHNKNMYFLDSRTTSQTRVPQAAMGLGLSYYERNIFLDNEKTRKNIINELKKGVDIANKKGVVIMIGHVWSEQLLGDILKEMYPILSSKGYEFSTVSQSKGLITP